MRRRIADAIGLREGEAAPTARLFVFIFLLTLAIVVGKSAQRGIFLAVYPRSRIPDAFVIGALCLAAASALTAALAGRLRPPRLMVALLGTEAVALLLAWLAEVLGAGGPPTPMIVYALVEVESGLLLVQGWAVVAEAVDVRSGKRLIPLVGLGAGSAFTLGGFGVGAVGKLVGTATLLPLAALLLGGAAAVLLTIERRDLPDTRSVRGQDARGTTPSLRAALRSLLDEPLLRVLAIIAMLDVLVEQVIDYQLLAAAQDHYASSPSAIAAFTGNLYGVTGAVTLVAPLVLSGRVLSRFGSARAVMASQVWVLLASMALLAAGPVFWFVVGLAAGERILKQALSSPGRSQMQSAVPAAKRAQAAALIKGVLAPLLYAAGGAVLKLAPPGVAFRLASAAAVVICTGLVAITARKLRLAYLTALRSSVGERRLNLGEGSESGALRLDREQCLALGAEIEGEDAGRAAFAIALLGGAGEPEIVGPILVKACNHAEAQARSAAVGALADLRRPQDVTALVQALSKGGGPDAERAVLRALARIAGPAAAEAARSRIDDPDPRTRALARACAADEAFRAMLASPSAGDRAAAAWAVGEDRVVDPASLDAFVRLLDDPDARVRQAAVAASGALGDPRCLAGVVRAVGDQATAGAAITALGQVPDADLAHLEQALAGAPPEILERVASAMAAGGGRAREVLLGHLLLHDHPLVRLRAARALAARRSQPGFRPPPLADVMRGIRAEIESAYRTYALMIAIARGDGVDDYEVEPPFRFLAGEIELRVRDAERRLLALLALIADPGIVRLAEIELPRPSARSAARAVEILEQALPGEAAALVGPLLERKPLRLRLDGARSAFPALDLDVSDPLAAIVARGDRHLARCALIGYREALHARFPDVHKEVLPMLPLVERAYVLRAVPLFHDLSGEDLMQVAEIASETNVGGGGNIFKKGELGDVLYVIVRGRVSVRDGGREIVSLGAGEFFGELAALDDEPRSADAVCVEDAVLLRIASAELEELMERRPEIPREIVRVLARRLRAATAQLSQRKTANY